MDEEIRTCVQSIFGDNVKIVDCEKNASVLEEELVHINGIPVNLNSLDGDDAHAIKLALLEGATPSVDILNKLLEEAGLLQQPMELETTLSVKSSLTTKQHVNVSKHGQLLDAHSTHTKEDSVYQTHEKVIWQPPPPTAKCLRAAQQCAQLKAANSNSTITTTTSTTTTSEQSTTTSQDSTSQLLDAEEIVPTSSVASLFNATYTSGQGLWQTNSAMSGGLESTVEADNLSRLTADLSIDSGYPTALECKKYKNSPAIIYEEGGLVSGTVEALIALLVPKHNYVPDTTFSYTFLLSARLFLMPQQLFEQMLQIWQSRYDLIETDATERNKSINNLLRLLIHWLHNFPHDFCLPKIQQQLNELMKFLPNTDLKPSFLQALEKTVTTKQQQNLQATNVNERDVMKLKEICGDALTLAQHLLQLELQYLSKISAEEFLMPNPSNIEAYKQWTQQLTLLAVEHILKFTQKKKRVIVLQYWLDTALECFYKGNFNSMWAIVHALRATPVARLKKMWQKVDNIKWSILTAQIEEKDDFGNYRASLKAAMTHAQQENHKQNQEVVVIPFFHVLQADIQSLAKSCAQWLPNGHIDYSKCLKFSEVVQQEFEKLRHLEAKTITSEEIMCLLSSKSVEINADTFMLWSFACESPHTAEEKKSLKILKSKIKASK